MRALGTPGAVLVTGACGHVGREVCRALRADAEVVALDLRAEASLSVLACDLRFPEQLAGIFRQYSIGVVIHLAAVLPTAFLADPVQGAEVNLIGSSYLLREAVRHGVQRLVFASSMSVYGSEARDRPLNEGDAAAPDHPYGACKRAIETVGETLARNGALQFVSLRIARVVGPGANSTSSPWRSQIFEPSSTLISLPFAPEALLSLVHAEDVARMLITLAQADEVRETVYNSPAEIWQAKQLQETVQDLTGARVELAPTAAQPGPTSDGSRFTRDFQFQTVGLAARLAAVGRGAGAARNLK